MPDWKQYASEIWYDSFARWKRGENLVMLASVVLSSLVLLLLWSGLTVAFSPQAGNYVSFSLALWLGFLAFCVSPFRVWRQAKMDLIALQKGMEPKLKFTILKERIWDQQKDQRARRVFYIEVKTAE